MPELRNFTSHVKLNSKLFKDIYQGNKTVNQKRGHHQLQEQQPQLKKVAKDKVAWQVR